MNDCLLSLCRWTATVKDLTSELERIRKPK